MQLLCDLSPSCVTPAGASYRKVYEPIDVQSTWVGLHKNNATPFCLLPASVCDIVLRWWVLRTWASGLTFTGGPTLAVAVLCHIGIL